MPARLYSCSKAMRRRSFRPAKQQSVTDAAAIGAAKPEGRGGDEEEGLGATERYTDVSQTRESVVIEPAAISIECGKGRARSGGSGGQSDARDRAANRGQRFRLAMDLTSEVFGE